MKKLKRVLNIASRILSFFMFLLAAVLAAMLLMGYKFFSVSTGSMEPAYPVGTLVIVQPVAFDELSGGDVITFKSGGAVVTHRVTAIETDDRLIHTKGDNNNTEDFAPVPYENVIGRVVYGVARVGCIVLFAKTRRGIIVCSGIIAVIFFSQVIAGSLEKDENDDGEDGR